ncbi:trypco2 family protein [Kitasatospora sp. NPDC003701]
MGARTDQVLRYLGSLRDQAVESPEGAGPGFADALRTAVDAFLENDESEQALLLAQELTAWQRSWAGPREVVEALLALGSVLVRVGARDEAGAVLDECVGMADSLPADRAGTLALAARELLSAVRSAQGRMVEALDLVDAAVEGHRVLAESDRGRHGALLARALHNRAVVLHTAGRDEEALAGLDEANGVYNSLLNGGDRTVVVGFVRSLTARRAVADAMGLQPGDVKSDALLHRLTALAASADADFDARPTSQEPADCPLEAVGPEETGERQTMSNQPLIPLPDVVQAVRLQVEEAAARSSDSAVGFKVGPIELDLTVSISVDARAKNGVTLLVVTDTAAGASPRPGLHRMRLTLTPTSRLDGDLLIGGSGGRDLDI